MHSRSEATATAGDNSGKEQQFQQLFHSEAEAGPTKIVYEAPALRHRHVQSGLRANLKRSLGSSG